VKVDAATVTVVPPVKAPQIEIRRTEMVVQDIGVNCVELMPVAEFAGRSGECCRVQFVGHQLVDRGQLEVGMAPLERLIGDEASLHRVRHRSGTRLHPLRHSVAGEGQPCSDRMRNVQASYPADTHAQAPRVVSSVDDA